MGATWWRIEELGRDEAERLRAVRLRALQDAPYAFGTPLSEAVDWPLARWHQSLEQMTTFVAAPSAVPSTALEGVNADVGVVRGVVHPQAYTVSLVSLWVAPEARRVGIARDLIDAVIGLARRKRMGRVVLGVVETNAAAITLYRKHGFVPTGERFVRAESPRAASERQFELLL